MRIPSIPRSLTAAFVLSGLSACSTSAYEDPIHTAHGLCEVTHADGYRMGVVQDPEKINPMWRIPEARRGDVLISDGHHSYAFVSARDPAATRTILGDDLVGDSAPALYRLAREANRVCGNSPSEALFAEEPLRPDEGETQWISSAPEPNGF